MSTSAIPSLILDPLEEKADNSPMAIYLPRDDHEAMVIAESAVAGQVTEPLSPIEAKDEGEGGSQ
jgi:hypothetical protein|tara:strand:- start:32 stop:226 length:195 start_codon:yes stop_codon:yes gene_type:complete